MTCMWLSPVLFFFFFLLHRSLFEVASLVSLAHFPRFCCQCFSIRLARKMYTFYFGRVLVNFLTVLLLFCMQNQIVNC